jgi:hypothetical protein
MDKVIASFGGVNSPIRISLITYEDTKMVDIRKFYRDRKTNEVKHTSKGIALTDNNFNELMSSLNDHWAAISNWVSNLDGTVNSDQNAQRKALTTNSKMPGHISYQFESVRGPQICKVLSEGDSSKVVFNEGNAFVASISKKKKYTESEVFNIISHIFVALDKAKYTSEVDGGEHGGTVEFGSLIHNSSRMLNMGFKND